MAECEVIDALVDSTRTNHTLHDVRAYRLARVQEQLRKVNIR